MITFVVTCCLIGASFEETFQDRLFRVDSEDPAELLELGAWCEGQGEPHWAYRSYRLVLELGTGPAYSEATVRMAKIEIARNDYEDAYRRLRTLVDRGFDIPEAQEILRNAETVATRRQRDAFAEGERCFGNHAFEKAQDAFVKAYKALPSGATPADFIPAGPILRRIARCVDKRDDQYYRDQELPFKRSIKPCVACKKDGGFCLCKKCGGKGSWYVTLGKRGGLRRLVTCGHCNGWKWRLCDICRGLCHVLPKRLGRDERNALEKVINKYRALKTLKLPINDALREMETVVLRVDRAPALAFLQTITPTYTRTSDFRDAIGAVPLPEGYIKPARSLWRRHSNGLDRADFLSAYTVEYAQYLRTYDCLRSTKRKPNFRKPPVASQPTDDLTVPEVLAAFPDEGTTGWVFVKGTLESYRDSGDDPTKGILEIRGAVPHNIRFFVWRSPARSHLARFERGAWRTRLSGFTTSYPFAEVHLKLLDAPKGYLVVVAGRFLRDRLRSPRNWFEVWDVSIGMTPRQEELFMTLTEPVGLNYERLQMQNLAQLLLFSGVTTSLAGVDGKRQIKCIAEKCPLGLLLEKVSNHLNVPWHCQGEKVVLGEDGSGAAREDLDVVLSFLRRKGGDFSLEIGPPGTRDVVRVVKEPTVPTDPIALKKRLKTANAAMDYLTAARCYRALREKGTNPMEATQLQRREAAVRLFHALTGQTPVSHLVSKSKIHTFRIETAAGETEALAASILEQGTDHYLIQPSYGGSYRLDWKKNRILEQTTFDRKQWRAHKEAELRKLEVGLNNATPLTRINTLFLLALFCKTNAIPERGSGYLLKLAREKRFGWLVATYWPRQAAELVALRDEVYPPKDGPSNGTEPPEMLPPTERVDPVAALPTSARELREVASALFRDGRDHLQRCLPGKADAGSARREALSRFRRAREALNKPADHAGQS